MNCSKRWDIFCKVIDNFGDIGVCWRLSTDLGARGHHVRLWVDDVSALDWMAPQGAPGVEVRVWTPRLDCTAVTPGDIVVEAFGCDAAPDFIANYADKMWATGQKYSWINLEYLSAESFAQRCHGLPSPVQSGPGRGLLKHFFYPGFTPASGGLLRESDLAQRRATFNPRQWLRHHGVQATGARLISLFCYEPVQLAGLLQQLAQDGTRTQLLVTAGRAQVAVHKCVSTLKQQDPHWNRQGHLLIHLLPRLSQLDFDHLLWSCDLNLVRGEDSLVRALWAEKPFVWQIYAQQDGVHLTKLEAFLQALDAPDTLQAVHRAWNADAAQPLPRMDWQQWLPWAKQVSARLQQQSDLTGRLLQFVSHGMD